METAGYVIVLVLLLLALGLAAAITAGISMLTAILDPGEPPVGSAPDADPA